jgi:hypothetical protein
MGPQPPGAGPLSPDFTGINPELMQDFISSLERGRDVMAEQIEGIRRALTAADVPTARLQQLKEIEGWIDDQLPQLRKRHQIIKRPVAAWAPGGPNDLVSYDEGAFLSPAEARRQGADLAKRFSEIEPGNMWNREASSDDYLAVLGELAAHKNDPDFTAAFFAALGPAKTLELPRLLRENIAGMAAPLAPPDPDDKVLTLLSQAFGTAVTAGADVPGFAAIKEAMAKAPAKSADVGALLYAGEFPAEWLAEIAVKQGLGGPDKVNEGILYALGNAPAAARLALSMVSKGGPLPKGQADNRPELKDVLKRLNAQSLPTDSGSRYYADVDAFGRMLAAAAGAYDEQDGRHSTEAARFAYTVMTTFHDLKVADANKIHLSEIAGAYATEIAEGANIGDANMTEPSAFTPVRETGAAFRLSPEDTYRFLKLFADSAKNLAPFETGMGDHAQRVVAEAAKKVHQTGDVTHLDKVFAALGNVRGFELAAVEKVQGDLDKLNEQTGKILGLGRDTAIGLGGMAYAGGPYGALAWFALSTGLAVNDDFLSSDDKRMGKVNSEDTAQTLGRRHTIANMLMANGFTPKVTPAEFQASCPPGVAIADAHGNLRPFTEIAKSGNSGLQAFERWLTQNGMGTDDKLQTFTRSA